MSNPLSGAPVALVGALDGDGSPVFVREEHAPLRSVVKFGS